MTQAGLRGRWFSVLCLLLFLLLWQNYSRQERFQKRASKICTLRYYASTFVTVCVAASISHAVFLGRGCKLFCNLQLWFRGTGPLSTDFWTVSNLFCEGVASLNLSIELLVLQHFYIWLCAYAEFLWRKRGKETKELGHSGRCQGFLFFFVCAEPAEHSSLLAIEDLMRHGGGCVFHLGLTVKAGISSAWTACFSLWSCGLQPPH